MENEIFQSPSFMVGYASMVYFVAIFTITKSRNEKTFKTKRWLKENWDDFLLTLVVGGAMVLFGEKLLEGYNDWKGTEMEMKSYFYLLPGPITDITIRIIKKFRNGKV